MRILDVVVLLVVFRPLQSIATLHAGTEPTSFLNNMIEALWTPSGLNLSRIIGNFDVQPCVRECVPSVDRVLERLSEVKTTDATALAGICKELESVESCAAASRCTSALYDVTSRAYKFVCVDKMDDFGASLSCAREAASVARAECEAGCGVSERVSKKDGVGAVTLLTDFSAICNTSVCLLGCMQRGVSERCQGTDTALFNAIIGTTPSDESGSRFASGSLLDRAIQGILPAQCKDVARKQNDFPRVLSAQQSGTKRMPFSVGQTSELRKADVTLEQAASAASKFFEFFPKVAAGAAPAPVSGAATGPVRTEWDAIGDEALRAAEGTLRINGEEHALQCRLLDGSTRKPVATPDIEQLARLIAEQLSRGPAHPSRFEQIQIDPAVSRALENPFGLPVDVPEQRAAPSENSNGAVEGAFDLATGTNAESSTLILRSLLVVFFVAAVLL